MPVMRNPLIGREYVIILALWYIVPKNVQAKTVYPWAHIRECSAILGLYVISTRECRVKTNLLPIVEPELVALRKQNCTLSEKGSKNRLGIFV